MIGGLRKVGVEFLNEIFGFGAVPVGQLQRPLEERLWYSNNSSSKIGRDSAYD